MNNGIPMNALFLNRSIGEWKMNKQTKIEMENNCPICGTTEIAEETDMTVDELGMMLCRNGHYFDLKEDLVKPKKWKFWNKYNIIIMISGGCIGYYLSSYLILLPIWLIYTLLICLIISLVILIPYMIKLYREITSYQKNEQKPLHGEELIQITQQLLDTQDKELLEVTREAERNEMKYGKQ